MAFGQQSGPPATYRQVQQLTDLVVAAGHRDFRDARGPLGLTQRQAGGKFTRDEADELIARLEQDEADVQARADQLGGATGDPPRSGTPGADPPADGARRPVPAPPVDPRDVARAQVLREMPVELLATELQRRGWVVMEP
jgi:hypothetical protein